MVESRVLAVSVASLGPIQFKKPVSIYFERDPMVSIIICTVTFNLPNFSIH